jgi:transcription initiation factor TFIID subunit 11
MSRYEVFRRANLNKGGIKKVFNLYSRLTKISNQILNQSIPQNIAIVISGFAKVFVGEIVEKAREIQDLQGDQGPLQPQHLREAWRLYKEKGYRHGGAPDSHKIKRLFK